MPIPLLILISHVSKKKIKTIASIRKKKKNRTSQENTQTEIIEVIVIKTIPEKADNTSLRYSISFKIKKLPFRFS